ncbi:helix-turn-helix domain-containing protein [Micromonospora sp. NPDC049151]|uniref:ATP-binding protein n=1 Tax=unclassified Micromonospora TaxID=2617518 RepID=UPI0034069245
MTPDHDRARGPGGRAGLSELLRGHRLAVGLTQAELADRAGVGVRTVRDLERGRATRPQRTTVDLLADALGLTGERRREFVDTARPAASRPPATGASDDPPVALPQPVPLLGRERDAAEVSGLLDAYPVVSLVGLAGVGKTALAVSVAHAVAARHPAGVAGVLVGEGSDTADVLAASTSMFGVNRLADLACRIGDRPALLVVDAVDRAPAAVAGALRALTAAAPTLRVLATGRRPVGLPGELVRPVAPLDVPPTGVDPEYATDLDRWPAAALFAARLAQVRREPPTAAELPALAALVRRLGGLPLAIELMAARGRILDVIELLDRYGDRVLDLTGVRPGWEPAGPSTGTVTLRDAVATSYHLLASADRAALRRLSAFRNRWSVELAEELLADGGRRWDAAPMLDRLRELGLLSVRGAGRFRFRLLDAVRDFAAEQADVEGETHRIRSRHASVIAGLVNRTAPGLVGPRMAGAVHVLDEATSDITAALAYAAEHAPETALLLAASLPRWWRLRGRDVAGRQRLRGLLADPRTADARPTLRAWAMLGAARLAVEHGAGAEELAATRAALVIFTEAGDVTGELSARSVLCALLPRLGAHDEARAQAEAALAAATRHHRVREMAVAQAHLTWHDVREARLAGARRRLATVDRLAAQCGDQRLRVLARADQAELTRLEGRYAEAVEQGRRVATALAELGDPGRRRRTIGAVGLALAHAGRADEALATVAELWPSGAVPDRRRPPAVETLDAPGSAGDARTGDALRGLIEGHVALRRGDRELAAEWFAAAADAAEGVADRRDLVEALVGLAVSTADPGVLDRLDAARRVTGVSLLPQEEELLFSLMARRGR